MMRTFTRADLDKARKLWADFSPEWEPYRKLAADGGLIYPPTGTKWDGWDDDQPSQRALLVRAIRENPTSLRRAIIGAPSWSVVLRRLIADRDSERDTIRLSERDAEWDRTRFTDAQAIRRLGEIIDVIRDSVA